MANDDTKEFLTQDMTLVTVLKMRGIEPIDMEQEDGGCQWVFESTTAVRIVVQEYAIGEAFVEAKEFSQKQALVRNAMYAFLKVPKRPVRDARV